MKRTDLLNHLIQKHGLKRYLEIGLQDAIQNFDKIQCAYKISVDPDPNAHPTFCMTSDEFFEKRQAIKTMSIAPSKEIAVEVLGDFDLIFIDGLHTAEQVKKDFENALKVLSPNGFIVLHDLLPENYERTLVPRPTPTGPWNGSCWKFGAKLGLIENFVTVNIDNGCGVWKNGLGYYVPSPKEWTWEEFSLNKKEIMNVVEWDDFIRL